MLFDYPRELRTNQALVVGMHAFFVKLGIASPIFIGASDGGMVAQIYTQKYPNEVGGLVLVFTGGMNAATMKTLKKKYFFVPPPAMVHGPLQLQKAEAAPDPIGHEPSPQ